MSELVADEFLAEKTAAITSLVGSVRRDIAEIGRHLSEVKERFARGDNPKFLAWASEAFGWSPATIYRYIEIFEFMRTGNFLNLRKLDLDLSSLYLLIAPSTTDEARAEVVKQAKTKKLAHADVKKTVARHAKPKAKKTAPAAKPRQPDPAPLVEVVEDSECKLEIGDGETIPYDEAVREGKLLVEQLKAETPEEFEEPQYMTVEPDAAPPLVHVDAAPGDVMVEHLRAELAAAQEDIDDRNAAIIDLKAKVVVKEDKIALLQARCECLEGRARDRVIDVSDILAEMRDPARYNKSGSPHMIKFWKGLESLPPAMMLSKKELVLLLERRAAIEGDATMTFHHSLDEGYRDDPAAEPEVEAEAEPAPPTQPAETSAQTWEALTAAYRASDRPLPEDHPKLIGAMVAFADRQNIDVEKLGGAPMEAKKLWLLTAKNCHVRSTDREIHETISTALLKRYGAGLRRVSVAAAAKAIGCRAKAVAEALDVMLLTDFQGRISCEKVGKEMMWMICRQAKEAAQ